MKIVLTALILTIFLPLSVAAEDILLELVMPDRMFGPGSACGLDLDIMNTGPEFNRVQLYVALTLGTGDYWFYPSWRQFPPGIDFKEISIAGQSHDSIEILPSFPWPAGTGTYSGALFISVVLEDDNILSNIDQFAFGWSETPIPTPTYALPTATCTPGDPTASPTSSPTVTPTPHPAPPGFIYIPSGSFVMGSPENELCRYPEEERLHEVILTKPFYMMQMELTQSQWLEEFTTNPSHFPGMDRPVENITWFDACIFCNRLSITEGLTPCYYHDEAFTNLFKGEPPVTEGTVYWNQAADGYRLPTESEWEYACRASSTTAYNAADNTNCEQDPNLTDLAWYKYTSAQETHITGQKTPNQWKLYDMHGNVSEWVWDWFDSYPTEPVTDPTGPETGGAKITRGGAFAHPAQGCRSAIRWYGGPEVPTARKGFRVVRTIF